MKKLVCLFVVVLAISCKEVKKSPSVVISEENKKNQRYNDIEKLHWLVGNWIGTQTDIQYYENWTKVNDSTLTLFCYGLVAKDTVFGERVILQQRGGETFFSVTDILKTEEPEVRFRLSSCENGIAIFENPEHDFPQKIIYHQPKNDTLYARIEGEVNKEFNTVAFYFTK